MLRPSHSGFIDYLKNKMNKYPYNEMKICLRNIMFDEKFLSKSKVFRIEVALRDSFG